MSNTKNFVALHSSGALMDWVESKNLPYLKKLSTKVTIYRIIKIKFIIYVVRINADNSG